MNEWTLAIYLAIGGVVFGLTDNEHFERCGYSSMRTAVDVSAIIATWPGWVAAAIVMDERPELGCKAKTEQRDGEME